MNLMHLAVSLLPVFTAAVQDESSTHAGQVTASSRSLRAALDDVLRNRRKVDERTLLFLIDPTKSLAKAGFAAEFEQALQRNASELEGARIGIYAIGRTPLAALPPREDQDLAVRAVADVMRAPEDGLSNVYEAIRLCTQGVTSRQRELILVSLDNGDAEDDLEATVRALGRTRFSAITSEAFLADSYWVRRSGSRLRGTTMRGGDASFVDLPWGYIFQPDILNEVTPSGFAQYGINRLASATGGKVYLYASASEVKHKCTLHRGCLFCSGDHIVPTEAYQKAMLASVAPSTKARTQAAQETYADLHFRATHLAWKGMSKQRVILSKPPSFGTASAERTKNGVGSWLPLTAARNLVSNARHAQKAAAQCKKILARLDQDIARANRKNKHSRHRAQADLTRVLLSITRVNLDAYAAWAREIGPRYFGSQEPEETLPPELPGNERRAFGIGFTSIPLCHGVQPILQMQLPGGETFRKELEALDEEVRSFLDRYAHTPYAAALRRAGIARFHPTYPGRGAVAQRRGPKSKSKKPPITETPDRPTRPVRGGSSRSGSGATSGGR